MFWLIRVRRLIYNILLYSVCSYYP